jgi:hypothetical protein
MGWFFEDGMLYLSDRCLRETWGGLGWAVMAGRSRECEVWVGPPIVFTSAAEAGLKLSGYRSRERLRHPKAKTKQKQVLRFARDDKSGKGFRSNLRSNCSEALKLKFG